MCVCVCVCIAICLEFIELYRNCPLKETVRLRMPFDWTPHMYIASPTIGVSLPQARRTREINSPRRFRPLMRNATPAGTTRPPFVQLFASSTGRPIYCQSQYTAWRRYLLAGKRARPFAQGSTFLQLQSPMCAIRVKLDSGGCINQQRVVTRARIIRKSPFYYALSFPLFFSLTLCVLVR